MKTAATAPPTQRERTSIAEFERMVRVDGEFNARIENLMKVVRVKKVGAAS
jgi:hypothetical protein